MRWLALLFAAGMAACSSSSDGQGAPDSLGIDAGADGGRRIKDLSPDEKKRLCDWTAAVSGGYGQSFTCETGVVTNFQNQEECLAAFPVGCMATVQQWETCIETDAKDRCALYIVNGPECQPLVACSKRASDAGTK